MKNKKKTPLFSYVFISDQDALGFHSKYVNLYSEGDQGNQGIGTTQG